MAAERTTGPPDFIGVGTQRSGTTWWFQHAARPPADPRAAQGGARSCTSSTASARSELTDADIAPTTSCSRASRASSPASGRRATCTTSGRRRSCAGRARGEAADHVPRPDRALPLRRAAPPESRHRTRASRPSPPTRSSAAATRRSSSGCARATTRRRDPDPAVREVRRRPGRPVPAHAALPRRRRRAPSTRPSSGSAARTQAANKQPLWDDLIDGLRAALEPEVVRARRDGAGDRRRRCGRTSPTWRPTSALRLIAVGAGEPGPPDFVGVGALGSGIALVAHAAARAPGDPAAARAARRAALLRRASARSEMTDADVAAYHGHFPRQRGHDHGRVDRRATCSTRGRRRCSRAPRPTRSCS